MATVPRRDGARYSSGSRVAWVGPRRAGPVLPVAARGAGRQTVLTVLLRTLEGAILGLAVGAALSVSGVLPPDPTFALAVACSLGAVGGLVISAFQSTTVQSGADEDDDTGR